MIHVQIEGRFHGDPDQVHFTRTLEIENIDEAVPTYRDNGLVSRYRVRTVTNNIDTYLEAEFEHTYGDDVYTIVAEAIDAIGGRGGPSVERGGLRR